MITIRQDVNSFINETISKNKTSDKITVLPLPCGTGKSTFIKTLIHDYLQDDKGLIIVTDSIDRMHDYAAGNDVIAEYLNRIDQRKIAILESGSVAETRKTLNHKPILILSTQRYFALTKAEIEELTKYDFNSDYGMRTYKKRELIVFDERPFIAEHLIIDTKTLNDIDTALKMTLDDTLNQADKQWMINQWQIVKDTLQQDFRNVEAANDGYEKMIAYPIRKQDITENDQNFLRLCETYKKYLNTNDYETYKKICTIMSIFKDSSATLISHKIKSKKPTSDPTTNYKMYHNYIHAVIDNQSKLTNVGAPVIVLDGTADLTPDYQVDYTNMIDCSDFLPNLNQLTINIVNVSTSKTNLCSNSKSAKKLLSGILKYIDNQPTKPDAIFSYKGLQDYITNHYQNSMPYAHFGDIKGTNDYRTCSNIIQIGLNRYPQDYYNLTSFYLRAQPIKGKAVLLVTQKYIDNVMFNTLLADIEQNLYRSRIRNHNDKTPVKYTLMFNTTNYAGLIDKIKERYESLGANVNVIDTPAEILSVKTQSRKPNKNTKSTKAQTIMNWLNRRKTEFKISDMLANTGIKRCTYNETIKRHPEIRQKLEKMKTEKRGYYKPITE